MIPNKYKQLKADDGLKFSEFYCRYNADLSTWTKEGDNVNRYFDNFLREKVYMPLRNMIWNDIVLPARISIRHSNFLY